MKEWFVTLGLVLVCTACTDKAKPAYDQCLQAEANGEVEAAYEACGKAVKADPESKSGGAAKSKLAELRPKHEALREEQRRKDQKAAQERAVAAEKARVAACKSCWVTLCKLNVEKAEAFKTKAKCDDTVKGFEGFAECTPCECGDKVPGGDIYCEGAR